MKEWRKELTDGIEEIRDARFAVINGYHFAIVEYFGMGFREGKDYSCSTIEVYNAEECYNLADAHHDDYSDENAICVFVFDKPTHETDVKTCFMFLIQATLNK